MSPAKVSSAEIVLYNPPIQVEVGKEYKITTAYGFKDVLIEKIYEDSVGTVVVVYSWEKSGTRKKWFASDREWTRVPATDFKRDVMVGGVKKITI